MNSFKDLVTKRLVLIFVVVCVSAAFFIFARYAYPVPAGDSLYFLVPAVQFAAKDALITPLYPSDWMLNQIIDPAGMKRFLFYPPLFPLFVSLLMPVPNVYGVFWSLAFINTAVLLISAFLFYKIVKQSGLTWLIVLLFVLSILAFASSLAETGRPEALARLWVSFGILVFFYAPKKYDWLFYGVLLGLMFVTHPAGGIFSLLIIGIMLGVRFKLKDVILRGSAILFLGFFTSLGIIALGPVGINETVSGIYRHTVAVNEVIALQAQKFFTFSNLFTYFVVSSATPFYGLVVILFLVASVYFYFKNKKRLVSPLTVFICAALLVYSLSKAIYSGHAFYIPLFVPLIFFIFILFFLEKGVFQKTAVIIVFALVATGFARTTLLFPFFVKQEATLERARVGFAELVKNYENQNVRFGVTGGFWSLTENYENVYAYAHGEKPKENTALVFFQQRYSGLKEPPEINGCKVVEDKFSRETPKIFGVALANTMPGYGYVVFNCLKEM